VIAVSNTTAITTLIKLDRIDLLAGLFGSVLIPSAVDRELKEYHSFVPACCELRSVAVSERLKFLLAQADAGEAEAICWRATRMFC
jgi:predicted nucleic acid-binding protein